MLTPSSPTISVIMSVFNGERFLRQAIDSILKQTFKDFEFIIINDGSLDNSANIVRSFKDSRIILINEVQNKGLTHRLNHGLSLAHGKYIARMDADDISLPTRFEKQFNFLESHQDIGFLGTNGFYIDEAGKKQNSFMHYEKDLNIRWGILFNSQFIHSSIMFRRSLLPLSGKYREDQKYAQDYEFISRCLRHTGGANLMEKLVLWRKTSRNISTQKNAEQQKFGTQTAMSNINLLFGNDFVTEHDEALVFRSLYRGTYQNVNEEQVRRFMQILEKFIETQKISFANERALKKEVAARMFESIYRKGLNQGNYQYLRMIIRLSPSAIPAGIKNLGWRAVKKAFNFINSNSDVN